jgi:hypothetical protein
MLPFTVETKNLNLIQLMGHPKPLERCAHCLKFLARQGETGFLQLTVNGQTEEKHQRSRYMWVQCNAM